MRDPLSTMEHSSNFRAEHLSGRDFSRAELPNRDFGQAILRDAQFAGCNLEGSDFSSADLTGANFKGANLQDVNFSNADLSRSNFYQAKLVGAVFVASNLFKTIFRESTMGQTVFANADMETCVGLDSVAHDAPSSIGIDCLYKSGHNLPVGFLRGAGLPPNLLDYLPELIQAATPIQFHSCFISYSHVDEAFARNLWSRLRSRRVRVWYAPEEMKGGRTLYEQIDRAIQLHDKLLILLSNASLSSNWVHTEIKRARKREKDTGERKLFPIRLCDMETLRKWECFDADTGRDIAAEIREYFIPDFSGWQKPDGAFDRAFTKLCDDLHKQGVRMQ